MLDRGVGFAKVCRCLVMLGKFVVGNLVVGLRDVASLCMRAVDVVVAS